MRRLLKWVGIICLIPIALVLLLAILLYLPPFQKFVINKAVSYANSITGMQISIDQVRIGFPLKLDVKGAQVILLPADTLLTAQELTAHIKPLPLLRKEVEFNGFNLETVYLNTDTLIAGMVVNGRFSKLDLDIDVVNLKEERVHINGMNFSDADIHLLITEQENEKDSTSQPTRWNVELDKITLERIRFGMEMPTDTLNLVAFVEKAELKNGKVDLFTSRYTVDDFSISNGSFNYDKNSLPPAIGFDPNHIEISSLNLQLNNIVYQDKEINAEFQELKMNERSGFSITSLQGNIHSDSTTIEIPQLELTTTDSKLQLMATIPWSALEQEPKGNIRAMVRGSVGKADLIRAAGQLPSNIQMAYPDKPLNITAGIEGNMAALNIRQLKAELPGSFTINASGNIRQLTDNNRRSGNLKLSAQTYDMGFVMSLLPDSTRERVRIPSGVRLSAEATIAGPEYTTRLLMTESAGSIRANARYNTTSTAYGATINIANLEPIHFLPQDSLLKLTANIQANGRGTDIYSASTQAVVKGTIQDIQYKSTELHDVNFSGTLVQNNLELKLDSEDPNANIDLTADGVLKQNFIQATIALEANHIDFQQLHLLTDTVATTFSLYGEATSNLQKDHTVDLTIGNWEIATPQRTYIPKIVTLHANTDADTTRVSLHTGDLGLVLTGNADLETMANQLTSISSEISTQLQRDTMVRINALRPLLPDMHLEVTAGTDNILYSYLLQSGIGFNRVYAEATTSPEEGINLDAGIYSFRKDTLRIDTILATIRQDTAGILFNVDVAKNRFRNQTSFTAEINGALRDTYAEAEVTYKNEKGNTGILLGVRANKEQGGINLKVYPDNPILAFRQFSVNQDNYILYRNKNDIRANLRLTGENNMSIWIHSSPQNATMQQLEVELNQFDLAMITDGFPQLPSMEGILNAEVSYEPSDSSFLVAAQVYVDTLIYEGGRVGEVMLNGTYVPMGNGGQQVDVHLFRDNSEVLSATGMYRSGTPDDINGTINIDHLPMAMISPFIPDNIADLSGALNGDMTITGSTTRPDINGYLQMDTASIYVNPAGASFRFDDKRIEVNNSLISFNQYNIYSESNDPFMVDGTVDIGNISNIIADLTMRANNMELLDSERNAESLVYGKLVIDLNATIKGPINALSVRGDIHLAGNTNVTYVMTESPLTVQDRMDGLVTFVSFADTFKVDQKRPQEVTPLGGMDILFVARIDQTVQLNVDLTADQSNRIEVIGGGDLTLQSNREGIIVLNGRYTLSGGTISYTLPIVPLKDFSIHEGSYVEWNGDPVDPTINITATERVRTSVASEGGGSRQVNFDVGIVVTGDLENLDLDFTLNSPDDGAIQSELASMGQEEVSRQAVGMLITGRYLAGGGDGNMNFDMGSALNTFLQNEIGNLAGDALKSVDISFDVDSYDNDGSTRTDYSFKFSKRFYNDRIQVVIGGRVSTGEDINTNSQTFIDDVSFEYRLDNSGTRYVKVFHDTNYESILEGEITETGVGLVLRKKMRYLRELFIFRKKKNQPVNETNEVAIR